MDRGFGWVIFSDPRTPVDWGYVDERRPSKNALCLARIERLIESYAPANIVLEDFEGLGAHRATRIRRLCRTIVHLAKKCGIGVRRYSRAQIRASFADAGAVTRYEIASVIAEEFDAVRHRLPRVRKPWMNEHPGLALFGAIAAVLTHFARKGAGSAHPA